MGSWSARASRKSFDIRTLVNFVLQVKSGERRVEHPVYSHHSYDILPGATEIVDQPDILILEGLNVLQARSEAPKSSRLMLSDLFDFSIYVDAETEVVERWYVERFLTFRGTAFQDPDAYFHRYASLSEEDAIDTARGIWKTINEPNLTQNILPTRERADLILEKAPDHAVRRVRLRKL